MLIQDGVTRYLFLCFYCHKLYLIFFFFRQGQVRSDDGFEGKSLDSPDHTKQFISQQNKANGPSTTLKTASPHVKTSPISSSTSSLTTTSTTVVSKTPNGHPVSGRTGNTTEENSGKSSVLFSSSCVPERTRKTGSVVKSELFSGSSHLKPDPQERLRVHETPVIAAPEETSNQDSHAQRTCRSGSTGDSGVCEDSKPSSSLPSSGLGPFSNNSSRKSSASSVGSCGGSSPRSSLRLTYSRSIDIGQQHRSKSPYGSPSSSPRLRRQPTRETRSCSISDGDGYIQLNQYQLKDQIGKVTKISKR